MENLKQRREGWAAAAPGHALEVIPRIVRAGPGRRTFVWAPAGAGRLRGRPSGGPSGARIELRRRWQAGRGRAEGRLVAVLARGNEA